MPPPPHSLPVVCDGQQEQEATPVLHTPARGPTEHLVTELMTLIAWTANDKSEQEAREGTENHKVLNVFMPCSSSGSSKGQS